MNPSGIYVKLFVLMALLGLCPAAAVADPGDDDLPELDIVLLNGSRLTANVVSAGENSAILSVRGTRKTYPASELHPWSLFEIRRLEQAKANPRMYVEYGRQELDQEFPEPEEADEWFERAVAIDAELQALVDQVKDNPAAPVDTNPDDAVEGQKFRQSDPVLTAAIEELSEGWFELIKKKVDRNCARVETDHFVIYTTWKKADHKALGRVCEKLYERLCKEFDIPADAMIWSSKLPVFVFWTEREFGLFVEHGLTFPGRSRMLQAGGFCYTSMGATYVVLNEVKDVGRSKKEAQMWFYEVLVHETTHAFNARYLSDIRLPTWFNEGIAEFMAADLVPGCRADKYWRKATRYVRERHINVSDNFERFQGGGHYFVVQSLVRFMAHKKKSEFIAFYKLLKEGKDQETALLEAYGWDLDDLLEKWERAARGI